MWNQEWQVTVKSVVGETAPGWWKGGGRASENGRYFVRLRQHSRKMPAFRTSSVFRSFFFLSARQPVVSRVLCYLGGNLKPAVGASLQDGS